MRYISTTLITAEELSTVDNFYNEIVDKYLESFLVEKELTIEKRIIIDLKKENQQLIEIIKEQNNIIDKLKYKRK